MKIGDIYLEQDIFFGYKVIITSVSNFIGFEFINSSLYGSLSKVEFLKRYRKGTPIDEMLYL